MADLALLEDMDAAVRRERVFRDRADLLSESDDWLLSRFASPDMSSWSYAHHWNRVYNVLSTLGFLATGAFQREIADRSGITQSTMSRILPHVLAGIRDLAPRYIRFPYNNAEQAVIKRDFHELAGFPNVIGAIDCTHVRLRPPSVNDYAYVNRKNYHSINVQLICDAHMRLVNVVARWPGSTHDTYIFQHSSVARGLQDGMAHGFLLGDKGYPLLVNLITPLHNPLTAKEQRFNLAHTKTRVVVERCAGLLKGRWMCLRHAGGTLLYTPEKVCRIILACSVLHNIALENHVPYGEGIPNGRIEQDPWPIPPAARAIQLRQELIHRF
ncbi:putative nuclease HARBI1 [Thalassophryne amazonica]|uniref:putative nuclease HARBI1 n=1 Tax=Thalassophryne amazonica TaxID=390379 RepID=UPI0014722F76|nr:putative nuclease HARBI1 [Thalassophryne amazonica]